MKQKEQALLARDMICMIREYKDDQDVLEYMDMFAFSLARGLEEDSIVSWLWDDLSSICDQRYYALKVSGQDARSLDEKALDKCERSIQKFLPKYDNEHDVK